MIASGRLKDLLSSDAYSPTDKLLICLAVDPVSPREVKDIRDLAVGAGLRKAADWNVSRMLSGASTLAVRTPRGWELTAAGTQRISDLVGPVASTIPPAIASGLRHLLPQLTSPDTKAFLEEAILCYESRLYRAAVVLSWVGAVSVLYDHVLVNKLTDFNAEAVRRDAKWRNARSKDDLSRMKEHEFLQILEAISLIGKNVKQDLETCLQLRNACGHPNSLRVGEAKVAAHVESLLLNVFTRF